MTKISYFLTQDSFQLIICIFQNNTYEIDNGYFFSDVKKGNFYQISKQTSNSISLIDTSIRNLASISATLDLESKHYKSSVYHFIEAIGTIGGIYELLFQAILVMYFSIRKNLYFYSFLAELNKLSLYGYQNRDHWTNDNAYHQSLHSRVSREDRASRGDVKRSTVVEHNKLLSSHDEAKVEENK